MVISSAPDPIAAIALAALASACQPAPATRPADPAAPGQAAEPTSAARPIAGFTPAAGQRERALEQRFLTGASPAQVSAFHRTLTAEPHRATSPRNTALARWVAEQWRAQGWEQVAIRTYEAYFSEPADIALEMVAPVHYRASLREEAYAVDPQTANRDISPSYIAFSASGEVTADVVYARGGGPEDYDLLRAQGIQVAGKIVLVRYSYPYLFRGFKVMIAEREGASAIVLYSDPADDGLSRGKTFPEGPWGPDSHFQRGLAAYASIVPGDPTTPGWASIPGAHHLEPDRAPTLPRIMVLALSARDARPLLEHMAGPQVPDAWRGGLPITYRFTGGVRAHLRVRMSSGLRTYTDVEARLSGSEHPEQWVSLGNHRDAWVYGGADASSGTAALLEVTRGLGALARTGWRPRRTIIVCSWDGEEEGMIGSTEWAEQHAETLERNLVAHINVDIASRGVLNLFSGEPDPNFEAMAVPSLAGMIVEASRDVPAPNGKTLYEAWRRTRALEFPSPADLTDANLVLTRIDPSSDHTVFLQHLGRPVIAMTYAGQYGVYHSAYDDRYYMEHFGDPGFHYSTNIAQLWGVLTTRLTDAELLPLDFVPYADLIHDALDALDALAATAGAPALDFSGAKAKARAFRAAAGELGARATHLLRTGRLDPALADELNRSAMAVEGNWLLDHGLPGRPWSRHLIHGMRAGFQPLLLPGVTDAVEHHDWNLARDQLALLAAALDRNTALLRSTAASLRAPTPAP